MADRKSALLWAVGWWFVRRWLRRRAALAVAGLAAGATARRGRLSTVARAFALVAVLAGAFLAWRRFFGSSGEEPAPSAGLQPSPPESPVAAP